MNELRNKPYDSIQIAVVIPVYNEAKTIRKNMEAVMSIFVADRLNCSYLLVNDGSSDNTWQELQALSEDYPLISAIGFSRNFGKEAAICAGLANAHGDCYLVMDSDLQHPPKYVKEMLLMMQRENADIIDGVKTSRGKENLLYGIASRLYYRSLHWLSNLNMDNSSDFKMLSQRVIDAVLSLSEHYVFFRGLVDWVGFRKVSFPFLVEERTGDVSRFSFKKLVQLAMGAILSYTSKPLYITVYMGALFLLFGVILGIQTLVNYFLGYSVGGFSTVILLLLIVGAVIMLSLGTIGIYISRIYDEVKGRPRFIVSDRTNEEINQIRG